MSAACKIMPGSHFAEQEAQKKILSNETAVTGNYPCQALHVE